MFDLCFEVTMHHLGACIVNEEGSLDLIGSLEVILENDIIVEWNHGSSKGT